MKTFKIQIILTVILLINISNLKSQVLAITEEGDSVYIYNNGTWSYELEEETPVFNEFDYLNVELDINKVKGKFTYSKNVDKQLTNADNHFIVKYDSNKWQRVPEGTLNEEAEFAFKSKTTDIWSVIIYEESAIEQDKLFLIAKKLMEDNTGSTVEILKTEQKNVNGTDVIRGVLKANFSGLTFIFDSYYFSNEKGSVQFCTWTSKNVWEKEQNEISEFLNGFIPHK